MARLSPVGSRGRRKAEATANGNLQNDAFKDIEYFGLNV